MAHKELTKEEAQQKIKESSEKAMKLREELRKRFEEAKKLNTKTT